MVASRLFAFTFVSQMLVFSCISVLWNLASSVVGQLSKRASASEIFHSFDSLPTSLSASYTSAWGYWTTWLPSRGFAAVFDLANLINLLLVQGHSLRPPVRPWMC